MGLFSTIGKIILFPIYAPYKAIKKYSQKPQENPIVAIVQTNNPNAYEYYFSGLGHETDVLGSNVIVWKKGLPEKERKEILTRLQMKLGEVI
jgi:hypothetical protein